MRIIGWVAIMAGFLAACSPANTDSPAAPDAAEPASAPTQINAPSSHHLNGVDLDKPLSLIGTEPFWSVSVSGSGITLKRPDDDDVALSATPFSLSGDVAELQHDDLQITLTAITCSDGMSDRAYPLTAQVVFKGKTLQGCAVPTADLQVERP